MQISSGSLLNSRLRKPPKSVQKRTSETLTVPSSLSQPRSCLSSVNRLFKAIEKSGLGKNPFPIAFQTAVSAIGGLFAGINILGELVEGDVVGALEDAANGAVSLHGGVKLVTSSVRLLKGLGAAGVILNGAFAIHDFSRHDAEGGTVHGATGIGLALSLSGALPAQIAGLIVLAATGLYRVARKQERPPFAGLISLLADPSRASPSACPGSLSGPGQPSLFGADAPGDTVALPPLEKPAHRLPLPSPEWSTLE